MGLRSGGKCQAVEVRTVTYRSSFVDGQKKSFLDSTCFKMKFAPRALSCITTTIRILRCFASLSATGCYAVGVAVVSFHPEKLKEFKAKTLLCGLDAAGNSKRIAIMLR